MIEKSAVFEHLTEIEEINYIYKLYKDWKLLFDNAFQNGIKDAGY